MRGLTVRPAEIISVITSCAALLIVVLAWRYESFVPLFPWAGGVMFIAALNVWRVRRKLRCRQD